MSYNTNMFLNNSDIYDAFNAYVSVIERPIKLIYPEKKVECINCFLDTLGTGVRSISKYRSGGPAPFEDGQPCPYCGGKGYTPSEVYDIIQARVYNNPKSWINKEMAIRLPANSIMVITKLEFAAQIKQAKYLMPYYNGLENIQIELYERSHELSSDSWALNYQKYVTSYWSQKNETK